MTHTAAHTHWLDKPVTLLGLSKSGIAAATYLAERGARCFLSETVPATANNKDSRMQLEALGVEVEMGGHTEKCYNHSDLIIVSPGIPPNSSIIQQLMLSGKTILSEVELAYREAESPFIGITGTNGKTTTTTLISRILEASGLKAPTCGNIGTPIIGLVAKKTDYLVAELSSFQLQFSPTLKTKVALMMNFRPDHLDWHGSLEAYKRSKISLFELPHTPEWAVLNANDPVCREIASLTKAKVLWFSRDAEQVADAEHFITLDSQGTILLTLDDGNPQAIFNIHDIQLVGAHNQENVLAAVATAMVLGVPVNIIQEAVTSFAGVEHRLEPVATVAGVTYYNDSKATNPDATLSALSAFVPQKVVLIAGGRDKKTDLTEFVQSIQQNAKAVVLIGEATERFRMALDARGYGAVYTADSLQSAVEKASQLASSETPVLFSPACASFDMFSNFESRGQAFKESVRLLTTAMAAN